MNPSTTRPLPGHQRRQVTSLRKELETDLDEIQRLSIGQFLSPHARHSCTTGVMTVEKLARLINEGLGQGHFWRYKPWTFVTRGVSSPVSYVNHSFDLSALRLHHCLSESRRQAYFCLRYLGAVDLRESFPIWPFPHKHPAVGLPGCEAYANPPDLAEIAGFLGVHLEPYPGTTLPRVQTIAVMGTWPSGDGYRLIAFDLSLKTATPNPLLPRNVRRRLARRYCAEAHIQFVHWPSNEVPEGLALNLAAIDPQLSQRERARMETSLPYRELVAALNEVGHSFPMYLLVQAVGSRHHMAAREMRSVFHLALWNQATDHDLFAPFEPYGPLVPGGRQKRADLQERVFGGLAP